MFCINPQASPECNVLMDEFVPFLQPGHKIGKVGTINNKNIINVVLTIQPVESAQCNCMQIYQSTYWNDRQIYK